MDVKKALAAFRSQKSGAKTRGISFNLTFKQWCEFWGNDIQYRGCGHDKLQMQRFADTGPYELGNIRKGYPRENTKTFLLMQEKKKTDVAKIAHEAELNRAMFEPSSESYDENLDESDAKRLGYRSSYQQRFFYCRRR